MGFFSDSLGVALNAINPMRLFGRPTEAVAMNPLLALEAYRASGLLRKVIAIPADDRTREWRDWQAPSEHIAAIEAEEKRLGLRAKVRFAEILRGIGGGALVLAAPGEPAMPINVRALRPGELSAVNVVSRWQIEPVDFVQEITDPAFGLPRAYKISGNGRDRIHPSRVIAFRGDPLPIGSGVSDLDVFWGDCRLIRVLREVQTSDHAQRWFAELVRKAKLLRFGISNLTDYDQEDLNKRVALIAQGENSTNATIYNLPARDGQGGEVGGEKIDDYQVNWAGIPAMMDAFDQRVAAVADIPFTRLMGRSPAGMNATGEYDDQNWSATIATGQNIEMRPCLEALDPVLLASAGVPERDRAEIWWKFAPLWKPSQKDEAERFKVYTDGFDKLAAVNAMPERAFNAGVQSVIEENGWMPGASPILADMSEDERFGLSGDSDDHDDDPDELEPRGGDPVSQAAAGGDGSAPARRAANDAQVGDATPRTLYVSRKVENVAEIKAWADKHGIVLQPDLHVTIAYSTKPVDWIAMGADWRDADGKGGMTIAPGGPRVVEPLGNRTAVLMFASSDLSYRNMAMREAGASWDWPDYQPHISLTGEPVDLVEVEPYRGRIVLGPEVFEEIKA